MLISEKQLQALILILKDTVSVNISGIFSIAHEDRLKLLNVIIRQQSCELKKVE